MDKFRGRTKTIITKCFGAIAGFATFGSVYAGEFQCDLMPIAVPLARVESLAPGALVDELPTGNGVGNYSWLTWDGSPSTPTLALSLTLPGNSENYVNPDDSSDTALGLDKWLQGAPGVKAGNAVKSALNDLLGQEIIVPLWDENRGSGNNFDYQTAGFARIALSAYKLNGNGWISFTFQGMVNCTNQPPTADNLSLETQEDQTLNIALTGDDPDQDTLTFSLVSQPSHGVLTGSGANLIYSPAANFHGTDSFTVRRAKLRCRGS